MMVSASNFIVGVKPFTDNLSKFDQLTKIDPTNFSKAIKSVSDLVTEDLIKSIQTANPKLEILSDLMSDFAMLFDDIKQSNASIVASATDIAKTTLNKDIVEALAGNLATYYDLGKIAANVTGAAAVTSLIQTATVPAITTNPLTATNPEKQAAMNANITPEGSAVVKEENSEGIYDQLIELNEQIYDFLQQVSRMKGAVGSGLPITSSLTTDNRFGSILGGDYSASDAMNGTYN